MEIPININPAIFFNTFELNVNSHIASLRNILRSIEDGTYSNKANTINPGKILSIQFGSKRNDNDIKIIEIHKCFKNTISSFIDYIDSLIGVRTLASDQLKLTKTLHGDIELNNYIKELIKESILKISRDSSMSNPLKIDSFEKVSDFSKKASKQYIFMRNDIEHHKAIAKEDRLLLYRNLKLCNDNEEIISFPVIVEGGHSINLKINDEERLIKKGTFINITENEIDIISLTLIKIITPEFLRAIAS